MPTFATQYRVLTMNMPVTGELASATGLGITVSTPTINTINHTVDLVDMSPATLDSQDNAKPPAAVDALNEFYASNQYIMTMPGHEVGYLVDVQGVTATKEIQLKGNIGNAGDIIVQTNDGPEWQIDYYSTIYDLTWSVAVPGTQDEGNNFAVALDPRNGFTQYFTATTGTNDINSIILPNTLPQGRRWAVRFELTDHSGYFSLDIINQNNPSTVTWLQSTNESIEPDSINVYEFYTRDGGDNWIGFKHHGMFIPLP